MQQLARSRRVRWLTLDDNYRAHLAANQDKEIYIAVWDERRMVRGARCLGYRQALEFLRRFKQKGPIQNEAERQ